MSSSYIWGTSMNGGIYRLESKTSTWDRVSGRGVQCHLFKTVSAVDDCVWALGTDSQLYIYALSSDVPIRCPVATYENQRWNPLDKFTGRKLLPTDRYAYSSEDGKVHVPKEGFKRPSEHWDWEEEWMLDENIRGEVTDKGGWQYAIDFPAKYHPEKKWNSCVRRRRWIRYRRYIALDTWAKISAIKEEDPFLEPFVDVAIGGQSLPNHPAGHLCVWAVSTLGKVYVRTNVSRQNPEGDLWNPIELGCGHSVHAISVGPLGHVWAVTWTGKCMTRKCVSWDIQYGKSWVEVEVPDENDRLCQVSVGIKAVWATCTSGKVWFRRGVDGKSEYNFMGTSWIQMVGEMSSVSIGQADQVLGIGFKDRRLYYRSGISASELSGKIWQPMTSQMTRQMSSGLSASPSLSSVASFDSYSSLSTMATESIKSVSIEQLNANSSSMKSNSSSINKTIPLSNSSSDEVDLTTKSSTINSREDSTNSSKMHSFVDLSNEMPKVKVKESVSRSSSYSSDASDTVIDFVNDFDDDVVTTCTPTVSIDVPTVSIDVPELNVSLDVHTVSIDLHTVSIDVPELNVSLDVPTVSIDVPELNVSLDVHTCQSAGDQEQDMETKLDIEETADGHELLNSIDQYDSNMSSLTWADVGYQQEVVQNSNSSTQNEQTQSKQNCDNESESANFPNEPQLTGIHWRPGSIQSSDDGISIDTIDSSGLADDDSLSLEALSLVDDMSGDLQWRSVNMMGCLLDNVTITNWLHLKEKKYKSDGLKTWRKNVLVQLKLRDSKMKKFNKYQDAIERSSWVKKGRMQVLKEDGSPRWTDCRVELELSGQDKGCHGGSLTVQYYYHGLPKTIQVFLNEIVCVYRNTPSSGPVQTMATCEFSVYTINRLEQFKPLKIKTRTESDLEDWVSLLDVACSDIRKTGGPAEPRAVWLVSDQGDIFFNQPADLGADEMIPNTLFWQQFGGHLKQIETNCLGITWGIGHDGSTWVYTGGYGGGMFKGIASSSNGINTQTDTMSMYIYENQRWTPLLGYSDRGLPTDRSMWSDETGKIGMSKEKTSLPSKHCHWVSDWSVDYHVTGGADKEGWQYATDFPAKYHRKRGSLYDFVRRRRWLRRYQRSTTGPWQEVHVSGHLLDISVQIDPSKLDGAHIAIWAIDTTGNILCRMGITRDNHMGSQWQHVMADHPCHAISVGAKGRVWILANDGSIWLRNGITQTNPTGTGWIHITPSPPNNFKLKQISAGFLSVWAVDTKDNLWYRKDITKTFPEGTMWVMVCGKVRMVSVSPKDQVWIIANRLEGEGHPSDVSGVVCRRKDITDEDKLGKGWKYGLGGGCDYICIRGIT